MRAASIVLVGLLAGCSTKEPDATADTPMVEVAPDGGGEVPVVPNPIATTATTNSTETPDATADTLPVGTGSIENLTWSVDSAGEIISTFASGKELADAFEKLTTTSGGGEINFEGTRTSGREMDEKNGVAKAVAAAGGHTWQVMYKIADKGGGLERCQAAIGLGVLPTGVSTTPIVDAATEMLFPSGSKPVALPGTPVGSKSTQWKTDADPVYPLQSVSLMSDGSVVTFSGVRCKEGIDGLPVAVGLAQTLLTSLAGAYYDPGTQRGVLPGA